MARVKVIGYLEVEDDEVDSSHPSGLTEDAYEEYFGHDSALGVSDLDNLNVAAA